MISRGPVCGPAAHRHEIISDEPRRGTWRIRRERYATLGPLNASPGQADRGIIAIGLSAPIDTSRDRRG